MKRVYASMTYGTEYTRLVASLRGGFLTTLRKKSDAGVHVAASATSRTTLVLNGIDSSIVNAVRLSELIASWDLSATLPEEPVGKP